MTRVFPDVYKVGAQLHATARSEIPRRSCSYRQNAATHSHVGVLMCVPPERGDFRNGRPRGLGFGGISSTWIPLNPMRRET